MTNPKRFTQVTRRSLMALAPAVIASVVVTVPAEARERRRAAECLADLAGV